MARAQQMVVLSNMSSTISPRIIFIAWFPFNLSGFLSPGTKTALTRTCPQLGLLDVSGTMGDKMNTDKFFKGELERLPEGNISTHSALGNLDLIHEIHSTDHFWEIVAKNKIDLCINLSESFVKYFLWLIFPSPSYLSACNCSEVSLSQCCSLFPPTSPWVLLASKILCTYGWSLTAKYHGGLKN